MLIGGGRMGYYLARQLLATSMDVNLIESDAKRCELSQLLPERRSSTATVRISACSGGRHQRMDAIAALTGIDERKHHHFPVCREDDPRQGHYQGQPQLL